jgi:hypothetical protein
MIVSYHAKVVASPYLRYSLGFDGEAVSRVKVGDTVVPSTVVFEGNESVILQSINVTNELGVRAGDIQKFLLKDDGEIIDRGEIVARKTVAVGTVERIVRAKYSGRVSYARISSGIVDIRSPFSEAMVVAGVHGKVVHIYPDHGHRREISLEVTAYAASPFLMIGSEMSGKLHFLKDGTSLYRPRDVDSQCNGMVVVAGRSLSLALYDALVAVGARGIIVGGIQKTEFSSLFRPALPIAVTEGWGIIPINSVLMSVMDELKGDSVYLDSKRKRIVFCPSDEIPRIENRSYVAESGVSVCKVQKGQSVQVWDLPYWGFCGRVIGFVEEERMVQVSLGGEQNILVSADSIVAIGEE